MKSNLNPEFVNTLPVKMVSIGDVMKRVRYDEATMTTYMLNDKDEWTGDYSKGVDLNAITKPAKVPEQAVPFVVPIRPAATKERIFVPPEEEEDEPNSPEEPQEEKKDAQTVPQDLPKRETAVKQNNEAHEKAEANSEYQSSHNPAPEEDKKVDTKKEEQLVADTKNVTENEVHEETPKKKKRKNKKKKPLLVFLIILILLALVAGGLVIAGQNVEQQNQPQGTAASTLPTQAPSEAEKPSETAENAEMDMPSSTKPETVSVFFSPTALIPGQPIQEDTFQTAQISAQEYRQLTITNGLYTKDDLDGVLGLTALKYIPAGKYISYDDLGTYAPICPWQFSSENTVTLAVSPTHEELLSCIWGTTADLTISVLTHQTNSNEVPQEEATTPDGVEHESSVLEAKVKDTYKLQTVQIIDIMDSNGTSLFTRYTSIAEIPSAFMRQYLTDHYKTPENMTADIPAFITVKVTPEQASLINSLTGEEMIVNVNNAAQTGLTELQMDTYEEILSVLKVIQEVWIAQEAEEAVRQPAESRTP